MKDKIKQILKYRKPQHITEKFLRNNYPGLYEHIINETLFIDYKSPSMSERIYHIINDIEKPVKCLYCGSLRYRRLHKFDTPVESFFHWFCSSQCSRKFEYKMNEEIITEEQDIIPETDLVELLKNSESIRKYKSDRKVIDSVKRYLNNLNIDYNRFETIEALHFVKNERKEIPKCCSENCNNYINYHQSKGYHKFCSTECNMNSEESQEKSKQTCLEKYGCSNASQSEYVKNRIANTFLEKYGESHPFKTDEYRKLASELNKANKEKNKERAIEGRRKSTYRERFINDFKNHIIPLFSEEEYIKKGSGENIKYKWKCLHCDTEFESYYDDGQMPVCPSCKIGTNSEMELHQWLKKIIDAEIQVRSRKVIPLYEIDLYIPEYSIAIEMDGLFWHSEKNGYKRNGHLTKLKECNNKGIHLIRIFEDEWHFNREIVKNRLKHMLGKDRYRINARNCTIGEITSDIKKPFLNKYHLQSNDKSSIKLGAFYKNRLVAVMTFCKHRIALGKSNKENCYELSRFCTVNNFSIPGIAGKLLNFFEKNYEPSEITTYADRRWSKGNLYYQMGFRFSHNSQPNYWYLKNYKTRMYRFGFRKSLLKEKLENYNPEKSEWENMKNNGYDRIWDCGNMVFVKEY